MRRVRVVLFFLVLLGVSLPASAQVAKARFPDSINPAADGPWKVEGNQASANFGNSVDTAGDVNGDGFTDVIVGAPLYDSGQTNEGRAIVYHGSAGGLSTIPDWTAETDKASANFGYSVGTAGDVNGDGYDDVIVGAYTYDHFGEFGGQAFVYQGSAAGLSATPDWTAWSEIELVRFGWSVGTAGDVNGDGYADVVVGAPSCCGGGSLWGKAFVYHGSAAGLSTIADWTVQGTQNEAFLGISVGTAGDVNRDGYDDAIVGAPFYNNGQTDEGQAYVYHGSAGGLSTAADWTAESDQVSAYFGQSVGTAGDVNGDGNADVIVAASGFDHGQSDEGMAIVYQGSAAGLSSTPSRRAEADQIGAGGFRISVGTAGDVNRDGYSELMVGFPYYDRGQIDEGAVFVWRGRAT